MLLKMVMQNAELLELEKARDDEALNPEEEK